MEKTYLDLMTIFKLGMSKFWVEQQHQRFLKNPQRRIYLKDVDEWKSEHLLLDDILLQKANKIMLVDWIDDSFQHLFPMICPSLINTIFNISQSF